MAPLWGAADVLAGSFEGLLGDVEEVSARITTTSGSVSASVDLSFCVRFNCVVLPLCIFLCILSLSVSLFHTLSSRYRLAARFVRLPVV